MIYRLKNLLLLLLWLSTADVYADIRGCVAVPDKDAHLLKQKDDEIKTTLGKEAPPIEAEEEVILQYENKIREKVRGILKEEYEKILNEIKNS